MNTTTKRQRKKERKAIIAKWQYQKAMMATKSTLKRIYSSSTDSKVWELYTGLNEDDRKINNPETVNYTVSDGYDVFLEALEYLIKMNKKGYWQLFKGEVITVQYKNGKEKHITLFQGMCRKIRAYIYKHGQTEYKKLYIEDFAKEDSDGESVDCYDVLEKYIAVPQQYDFLTYEDYKIHNERVKALNLTNRQKQILHLRKKGFSVAEIAEKLSVKQNTISSHLEAVQFKYERLYPESLRGFQEKRGQRKKA